MEENFLSFFTGEKRRIFSEIFKTKINKKINTIERDFHREKRKSSGG